MASILTIVVLICLGMGYYAWRQQQNALGGLQALKDNGVAVTFSIRSRPLLAVDAEREHLYLISGSQAQQPLRMDFRSIKSIVFRETSSSHNDSSEPTGPDTLTIELNDGSKHRVGDLPHRDRGAKSAMQLFRDHGILTDKLTIKWRRH